MAAIVFVILLFLPAAVWFALMYAAWGPPKPQPGGARSEWAAAAEATLQTLVSSVAVAIVIVPPNTLETLLTIAYSWPFAAPALVLFVLTYGFNALALPLVYGVTAAGLLTGLFLVLVRGRLRAIWPTVAVVSLGVVMLTAAEWRFHSTLSRAADELKPDCMDAGSFLAAVRHSFPNSQSKFHAAATKDAKRYAWSFRKNSFYVVPEGVPPYVTANTNSWFQLPYPSCGRS